MFWLFGSGRPLSPGDLEPLLAEFETRLERGPVQGMGEGAILARAKGAVESPGTVIVRHGRPPDMGAAPAFGPSAQGPHKGVGHAPAAPGRRHIKIGKIEPAGAVIGRETVMGEG